MPTASHNVRHLATVHFKALAELDVGAVDRLFQHRLALGQRQLSEVIAVEIEQVEGDKHEPGRLATTPGKAR